jgi:hypothetical protein
MLGHGWLHDGSGQRGRRPPASFLGLIYEATLFTQQVLHYPPLAAGSATIPIAVLSLSVSAKLAPKVVTRIGVAKTLAIGMVLLGAGLLLLTRVPTDASYLADIFPAFSIVGIGLGFTGVDEDEAGLAGGAVETSREMGGALGLALLVSVALGGTTNGTEAFHRSVLAAAIFAAASAFVAITLLRPTERRRCTAPGPATAYWPWSWVEGGSRDRFARRRPGQIVQHLIQFRRLTWR